MKNSDKEIQILFIGVSMFITWMTFSASRLPSASQTNVNARSRGQTPEKVIMVINAHDHGVGSLRQALLDSQGGETILFDPADFSPDEPVTIFVLSPLPSLAEGGVIIDAANAGVILAGSHLPREQPVTGLDITSSGNAIRGLMIFHFQISPPSVMVNGNN